MPIKWQINEYNQQWRINAHNQKSQINVLLITNWWPYNEQNQTWQINDIFNEKFANNMMTI